MLLWNKKLDIFRQNKLSVLEYWLAKQDMQDILLSHKIEKKYFIQKYASIFFDYYMKLLTHQKDTTSKDTLNELILFLKNKNISSHELFVLCTTFKSSVLHFCHECDLFQYELVCHMTEVYETRLMGILITQYSKKFLQIYDGLEGSLLMLDKYIIMSRTNSKGIITRVSEAFCQISGYTKEELIGNTHHILRDSDVHDEFYEDMWKVLKIGKIWKGEIKNRNKNGKVYWVYATIEPHFSDEGEILYYDAIRQDITSKKEAEEQHHMLIEQSKYITMSEVISMIAHQWRQPLQAVAILIQKLPITKMVEGKITDELLDQTVEDISLQLNYMSNTIDDFREFFKPSKNKTSVKLSYVVDQAISFLSYMFNVHGIVLEIKEKQDTEILLYDREIIQVLINIMKNAKDILVEKQIQKKKLFIRYCTKNHRAIIEIEDNAKGVPLDIMNRIFEPYFSTKQNKNGTGLGLYMSKMIIEEHSLGRLSVKNVKEGAVFKIELPL